MAGGSSLFSPRRQPLEGRRSWWPMHFLLRLERVAGVERAEASAEPPNNNKEHSFGR